MKVLSIEPYKSGHKIMLEGAPDCPLFAPGGFKTKIGNDIDPESLELVDKGDFMYFILKEAPPTERSRERENSIRAQVALKAIVDLEVADKLDEFTKSKNHLAMGACSWIEAALVHDNEQVAAMLKERSNR